MEKLIKCTVLHPQDLAGEPGNSPQLEQTAETIFANVDKFYLVGTDVKEKLHRVIEKVSKASGENVADIGKTITRTHFAYELYFDLPTMLYEVGNGGSEGKKVVELKKFSELLEKIEYNEHGMPAKNYRIIIDDEYASKKDESDDGRERAEWENSVNRAVAELFQQLVFLNIDMDIQKKSEAAKKAVKDRFRANYGELLQNATHLEKAVAQFLDGNALSKESRPTVETMQQAISVIQEQIKEASERPIRIAAMGTKKAGKSVIINSLLKEEYAPTSPMLPTPNCIIYVPSSEGSEIKLEYKGNVTTFRTAEDIKAYIQKEFEYAQDHTGEGSGLADMIVHYPSSELTGFEIYDTPGPNFAGAGEEHHKIAEECIKKADVCIFVMNYSNHLTDDEVKFLKKIRNSFEKANKFYSFFIAVNRIDERYAASEEKSVTRIVDYIRHRLDELDYHNIVSFGTSALQSFYLEQMSKLVKKIGINDNGKIDKSVLEKLEPEGEYSDDLAEDQKKLINGHVTQYDFLDSSFKKLMRFHGIRNATDKDLALMSGMPQLEKHAYYIGSQKADTEIVDAVVSRIDMQMVHINNGFIITNLVELKEKDKDDIRKLSALIEGLHKTVDKILHRLEAVAMEDKMKSMLYDAKEHGADVERNSNAQATARINDLISNVSFTEEDMKLLVDKKELPKITDLIKKIEEICVGINNETESALRDQLKILVDVHSKQVEEQLTKAQSDISVEVQKIDAQLDSQSNVGEMFHDQFQLPTFPASLKKPESTQSFIRNALTAGTLRNIASNNTGTHQEAYTEDRQVEKVVDRVVEEQVERKVERQVEEKKMVERDSDGIWEGIKSFLFDEKYYEEKTFYKTVYDTVYDTVYKTVPETIYEIVKDVKYKTVMDYDVKKFTNDIHRNLAENVRKSIEIANAEMQKEQENQIRNIFSDLANQCREFSEDYGKIFRDFNKTLNLVSDDKKAHSAEMERDVQILTQIQSVAQPFLSVWNKVLHG